MTPKAVSSRSVFTSWIFAALLLSCLFVDIEARKLSGSSSKSKSRPSGSGSRTHSTGHASKPDTSHADAAKLSYSNYNSAPNPPRHAQPASAPAASAPAAKPIGWNVPANTATGGVQRQNVPQSHSSYPGQGSPAGHAPYQPPAHGQPGAYPGQAGAYPGAAHPPPYQANVGAPPPYSPHSNANPHVNAAPPPYMQQGVAHQPYPAGAGYPGAHYPAAGGHPPANYPAGSYPAQPAYPQGAAYPVQPGYAAGGAPAAGQPVVNNYYGNGGGGGQLQPQRSGGSGLQTALIAGVGGLALYGALKPSGKETVIIHEVDKTVPTAVTAAPAAVTNPADTPKAAETPVPLAPLPGAPMNPPVYNPQYPAGAVPPYDPNAPQGYYPGYPGPYQQPGYPNYQQPGYSVPPFDPSNPAMNPAMQPSTLPGAVAPTTVPIVADGQVPLAPVVGTSPAPLPLCAPDFVPLAGSPVTCIMPSGAPGVTLPACAPDYVPLAGNPITCSLPTTPSPPTTAFDSAVAVKDLNAAIPIASNDNHHSAQTAASSAAPSVFSTLSCLIPSIIVVLAMW